MIQDTQKNQSPISPSAETIGAPNNKKNIILVIVIVGIVLIGIGSFVNLQKNNTTPEAEKNLPELPKTAMNTDPLPEMKTDTQAYNKALFTKPESIIPSGEKKIYSYLVTAEKGILTPKEIIIPKNQLTQITFTSRDSEFDLLFPKELGIIKTFVKQNEESPVVINTQQTGIFPFNCQKKCPQNNTIEGTIVIK